VHVARRTASPPKPAPGAGRIPQLPALDGLRAVAVVAVLLWHADVVSVRGGFLGVESFFVVSGYLITSLLWTERMATGRTSLRGFWLRRARRLLPALYLLLVGVMAGLVIGGATWFEPWRELVAKARGDAAAAAVYVSNWYQLQSQQSYFDVTARPSPFRHLWSLAVEEQFYVLWPLLLLVLVFVWRGDRARIAATVFFLAAASALAMAFTFILRHEPSASVPYDPSRLYYGLDTRAGGLLLGCALALVWRPWERADAGRFPVVLGRRLPAWWADTAAGSGLLVLLVCFWRLASEAPFVYTGGLQLVAVATALVIAGTALPGTLTSRLLGVTPLVALGRRSYSLYLWHWPVYVVTRPGLDIPWSPGPTLLLRLALSAALAELSYRYVEVPVRNGALGRGIRRVRSTARAASPARRRQLRRSWAALTAIGTALFLGLGAAVVQADAPAPLASVLASGEEEFVGPVGVAPDPLVPLPAAAGEDPTTTPSTNPAPPGADPNAITPGAPTTIRRAEVYAIGDSVMLGARDALAAAIPGLTINAKVGRFMGEGSGLVSFLASRNQLPNAIVVHLGSNGPASRSEVVDLIEAAGGRRVVFVTVRVPRRWEGTTNAAIAEGVKGQPNVRVVDWKHEADECEGDQIIYADGIHLQADGAACYANLIRSALR
jgi:peptidoglycan/LPS O-acetylase OafA/YrhL